MFRREKFVPRGGPNGGDGGRGGHVVFEADGDLNTLFSLRFKPIVKAKPGQRGGRNNCTGRAGEDLVIRVPVGTTIKDHASSVVLADLDEHGDRVVILEGGRGGRGNARFKTSRNRAPTQAEPGGPAKTLELQLELKLLADVGLLGFPNAGKSTLISRMSAAKPKVAAYPFTTLEPSLGVVAVPGTYRSFVAADIPGLIEGAADGAGLGHRFLRHVERCAVLLHLLSLDPLEDETNGAPIERYDKINSELARYDSQLAGRPQVVMLSKLDLAPEGRVEELRREFEAQGCEVFAASSVTGAGIDKLIHALARAVDRAKMEGKEEQ
jgi:GTP-binding protein